MAVLEILQLSVAPSLRKVKKSKFTFLVDNEDGNYLCYNTFSGKFLKVPVQAVQFLLELPSPLIPFSDLNPFQSLLFEYGMLVPADADESRRSRMMYTTRFNDQRRLELIL